MQGLQIAKGDSWGNALLIDAKCLEFSKVVLATLERLFDGLSAELYG